MTRKTTHYSTFIRIPPLVSEKTITYSFTDKQARQKEQKAMVYRR